MSKIATDPGPGFQDTSDAVFGVLSLLQFMIRIKMFDSTGSISDSTILAKILAPTILIWIPNCLDPVPNPKPPNPDISIFIRIQSRFGYIYFFIIRILIFIPSCPYSANRTANRILSGKFKVPLNLEKKTISNPHSVHCSLKLPHHLGRRSSFKINLAKHFVNFGVPRTKVRRQFYWLLSNCMSL